MHALVLKRIDEVKVFILTGSSSLKGPSWSETFGPKRVTPLPWGDSSKHHGWSPLNPFSTAVPYICGDKVLKL